MTRQFLDLILLVCFAATALTHGDVSTADDDIPAWTKAHLKPPMTRDETTAFIKMLAEFVFDNHLKTNPDSEQRGMVYEYFVVDRKGQFDQFVQGEGLDTMHDGAWFAAAMVTAYRATGNEFYKRFLAEWQLPFYLKMLNHSDELFTAKRNDARPTATPWGKPWAFQEGEKGFVPYFWDDGGSVSIERRREQNLLGIRPCVDFLAGKPNPQFLLNGHSQGMSNHMAQDLGVMVQLVWLLLKDSEDEAGRKLAGQVAEAAKNLHECRMRHFGRIPMCVAPAALAAGDPELMRHVPDPDDQRSWTPDNHYVKATYGFQEDQRYALPGFADDAQYRFYYGIAKTGGKVPRPLAFKLIYDAYTEPLLYRSYSDDAPVPAGVNRFDLHPYYCENGKHLDYRSDRKGPFRGPRPIGSRMGPQNMIVCGWALQLMRAYPGIWEERYERQFADDLRVYVADPPANTVIETRAAETELNAVRLKLASSRDALTVSGEAPGDAVAFKVFSRPDGQDTYASIQIVKAKKAIAENDSGQPLEAETEVTAIGNSIQFRVQIPYTVTKSQKLWANGLEHGRYSIAIGDETRNFYLASDQRQVEAWLKHELAGGLRTWEAILQDKGYIPTGMNAGFIWDGISDSGGYAHLISAASQWVFYLDDRRDWEVHRVPGIDAP